MVPYSVRMHSGVVMVSLQMAAIVLGEGPPDADATLDLPTGFQYGSGIGGLTDSIVLSRRCGLKKRRRGLHDVDVLMQVEWKRPLFGTRDGRTVVVTICLILGLK